MYLIIKEKSNENNTLNEKLDSLNEQFNELSSKYNILLKSAKEKDAILLKIED